MFEDLTKGLSGRRRSDNVWPKYNKTNNSRESITQKNKD